MADQIEEMEYPGSINVTLIRRVVAQSRYAAASRHL